MFNQTEKHTALIKKKANELGFFFCGVSKADFLEDEARQLDEWLKRSYNGKMSYMENHFDKRLDPRLLVDDAKISKDLLERLSNKALRPDFAINMYGIVPKTGNWTVSPELNSYPMLSIYAVFIVLVVCEVFV